MSAVFAVVFDVAGVINDPNLFIALAHCKNQGDLEVFGDGECLCDDILIKVADHAAGVSHLACSEKDGM